MDLIAFLSTPAIVASVTILASALTLWLANRHADRIAERQAGAGRERLRFDAHERRYEDRRDTVIELDRAVDIEINKIQEIALDPNFPFHSPGDLYEDYRFPEMAAAHARVVMLATPDVVEAADELRESVFDSFHGKAGCWDRFDAALTKYRTMSRAMLANDFASESSP